MFYAFPQLMNDVDCKLSGVHDFGSAEIKEDCSLDYSNCIKNEGNLGVHLSLALCCLNVRYFWCYYFNYNSFIELSAFLITGCGTSELFPGDEDVIDLKVEPLEVSEYI